MIAVDVEIWGNKTQIHTHKIVNRMEVLFTVTCSSVSCSSTTLSLYSSVLPSSCIIKTKSSLSKNEHLEIIEYQSLLFQNNLSNKKNALATISKDEQRIPLETTSKHRFLVKPVPRNTLHHSDWNTVHTIFVWFSDSCQFVNTWRRKS